MRDPTPEPEWRPPEPEWRLPEQDAGPDPRADGRPVRAVLISLLALAVLCCGGGGFIRAFTGGGTTSAGAGTAAGDWQEPKPFARSTTATALLPVPVTTSGAGKTPKRPKRPSTRPAKKARTKATTKPTPRRTTSPAPSPTITA